MLYFSNEHSKDNLDKSFIELLDKFEKIKSMGYVKSINKLKNGSGFTLEHYLGSTSGDFCIPDFEDIEIKSIRKYKEAEIGLFSSAPDGKYASATQWLSQNYGYPIKGFSGQRGLSGNITGNKENKIGLFYYFKLKVDYSMQKIILEIYNKDHKLINNDVYWDFDSIEDKLNRKLSKLAVVESNKKKNGEDYYYHYDNIKLYKSKSFDVFLNLIELGIISLGMKTGVYKSGKYIGKFHDHGCTFRIQKNNLERLFDRVY